MSNAIQKHLWSDLSAAPSGPGVYAWYYRIELTRRDVEQTIAKVKNLNEAHDHSGAENVIRELIEDKILKYFKQDPYRTKIEGQLKATYSGDLEHIVNASAGLVERLAQEPERLWLIRNILEVCSPNFACPIYIGMADNLRRRLAGHKSAIEKFRARGPGDSNSSSDPDICFAWHVANRRIPPERLIVFTCETVAAGGIEVDIENLLNRIFYPVLGRN